MHRRTDRGGGGAAACSFEIFGANALKLTIDI